MTGHRIYLHIADRYWERRADEIFEHRAARHATHTFSMVCNFFQLRASRRSHALWLLHTPRMSTAHVFFFLLSSSAN